MHGVSRETIPDLRTKLGERFNCAILVREPLPRLRSQMALFENWPVKSAWNVDYVQTFIDQGVRLPEDNIINRLFLHGVNMLNSIIQEEPVAPIWRSEDLTSNATMLARFIEELTRGHVQVELGWAERSFFGRRATGIAAPMPDRADSRPGKWTPSRKSLSRERGKSTKGSATRRQISST